jgi:hypothetical protein
MMLILLRSEKFFEVFFCDFKSLHFMHNDGPVIPILNSKYPLKQKKNGNL